MPCSRGGGRGGERVRSTLAERSIVSLDGVPIRVSASFGVAASRAGMTGDALVNAADETLYRAKRPGKDRVLSEPPPAAPS